MVGLTRWALRDKGAAGETIKMGLLEHVRLLTTEATVDQTFGNWYHFMKHIQQ
jgi:hypothetical protein